MDIRRLQIIPDWHGDETLYSWSVRMHRLLGSSVKDSGLALYGAAHAYKEWAASSRLGHFCNVTDGRLGDARAILLERTVLAAFYPFLRSDQRDEFDRLASSSQRTPWLTRFGMRASALQGAQLRWCGCCAQQDMEDGAAPRWRLPHQLPGAWWCMEHDQPLLRLDPGSANWVAPEAQDARIDVKFDSDSARSLLNLSALAGSLVGKDRINLVTVKRAMLSRLRDLGVVSSAKPLSALDLQHWFDRTHIAKAVKMTDPELHHALDRAWVYEILRKRRVSHPLLWLMLWAAIFEGCSTTELVHGFHEPDATRIWGEDGQGQLWLERDFQGDTKVQAIVRNAETVQDAARLLNVSITTVRRYLREAQCFPTPIREADRRQMRKQAAVAEIESVMREKGGTSKTEVHRLCKASVSWLKRWEPELLASMLSRIPEARARQLPLAFDG